MLLKIDQELKNLIPPLTDEDRIGLENNIKANGCETPITVWDGTIIDGHNRYEICIANGIPFEVKEMHFADKDDAKVWMIKHELEWKGRRLLPAIRLSLTDKMRSIIAEKAKSRMLSGKKLDPMSTLTEGSKGTTREEIAKLADVSTGTVAKYDIIQNEGTDEQKAEVLEGKASINKVYKEIKGSKLKTPDALLDDFEPEEIVYEKVTDEPELSDDSCSFSTEPPTEEQPEMKGMCPCGCGYRYDEENKKWYNENDELITMVLVNVNRNTYERLLRRRKQPEEKMDVVVNRILDGEIHEQPR